VSGAPLLDVRGLRMHFRIGGGWVRAVDDVSFSIERAQTLGLVGESGCGKTSAALAVIRLLPENGHILGGQVLLDGIDVTRLLPHELRQLRWTRAAIIFQGAMNALNPVFRVGDQLMDALMLHRPDVTRRQARERVVSLFEQVGLQPARMVNYPHEFSGGMKQRAMIAMSLLLNPDLIIADEPTTALDVVIQDQIVEKLKELQLQHQQGMIVISHDISVVAETCDLIAVMYGGKIVEYGDIKSVFARPSHPYTIGLLRSFPSVRGELRDLVTIPGEPPDLVNPPPGCRFEPRCPVRAAICGREEPPQRMLDASHRVACHLAGQFGPDEVDFQRGKW